MSMSQVFTVVVGLAAAGAAGAGVASWWQSNADVTSEDTQSEGFSGDQLASIEGIVGAYIKANPAPAQEQSVAPAPIMSQEEKVAEVEGIVRNFLLTKPEIMREVFAALETKDQQDQLDKVKDQIANNASQIYGGTEGLVLGNPEGDVTVVEFFDYNCGYCKRALDDLTALIAADSNVKVIMKEFPILSPASIEAAKVSLAVARQGKYMEFHSQLLKSPGQSNGAKALKIAESLGLDMPQIQMDMNSREVQAEIEVTQALASDMGIRGTPAYLVGEQLVPGAVGVDTLREMIQKIRDGNS